MKRAFDSVVAVTGLIFGAPLMAAGALAVRLTSPGPILYRGARVGLDGRRFHIIKFRTMIVAEPGQDRPALTTADDARLTAAGRYLRRTKIDELPQLVNVLRGEMSIVGPRPEDPAWVDRYTAEQKQVLSVRPGLTSPASILFRNEAALLLTESDAQRIYEAEILPAKLREDLQYVRDHNLWLDLRILSRTLWALFSGVLPRPPNRPR